jgi:ComF family protein
MLRRTIRPLYSREMPTLLDRASRVALDLLFPPRCGICRAGGALLCDGCIDDLPPADGHRCQRCWMPVARGALCGQCSAAPPAYVSIRAPYVMDGAARRLAHELKYEGMTALADPMARLMLAHVDATDVDVVVAVPLHRSRKRARGYNQAEELAKQIAALTSLRADRHAVRRIRATAPLVKTMHREDRAEIMCGAFAASRERIDGTRLLLVDDVVTTGATLDACAQALRSAGAREVRCVTWARAD